MIDARTMQAWEPERRNRLLGWMVDQGYSPNDAASLTLESDGSCTVTLFMRDVDGKRRLDYNDDGMLLTVEVNFTPTTPCPEQHSNG